MARKNAPPASDEDFDEVAGERAARSRDFADSPLDARMLDLDDEVDSPFLRGQKRVPVRRGALVRTAASRIKLVLMVLLVGGFVALVGVACYRYATQSWRFRLESGDDIEIVVGTNVSRGQIMDVMGSDLDRNVFFVPLAERKKQLEEIAWVQSASVMRFLPNRLRVVVEERTPVAFVVINGHISLIDQHGVVMDYQPGQQANYSFPVIVGMSEDEPLSTRAARMKLYIDFMQQLDSSGSLYSHDISDVDLSDPEDLKATVSDAHGAVLVHLGSSNFLERFKIFVTHVQEWRTQFVKLQSVDLRYEHQVIVNPDLANHANDQDKLPAKARGGDSTQPNKTSATHKGKKHT